LHAQFKNSDRLSRGRHIDDRRYAERTTARPTAEHYRQRLSLKVGDFGFYETTRPYRLTLDGPFEQLVMKMPRRLIDATRRKARAQERHHSRGSHRGSAPDLCARSPAAPRPHLKEIAAVRREQA
jgi:hypothetical protein